jgi:hypothetical protein
VSIFASPRFALGFGIFIGPQVAKHLRRVAPNKGMKLT